MTASDRSFLVDTRFILMMASASLTGHMRTCMAKATAAAACAALLLMSKNTVVMSPMYKLTF